MQDLITHYLPNSSPEFKAKLKSYYESKIDEHSKKMLIDALLILIALGGGALVNDHGLATALILSFYSLEVSRQAYLVGRNQRSYQNLDW